MSCKRSRGRAALCKPMREMSPTADQDLNPNASKEASTRWPFSSLARESTHFIIAVPVGEATQSGRACPITGSTGCPCTTSLSVSLSDLGARTQTTGSGNARSKAAPRSHLIPAKISRMELSRGLMGLCPGVVGQTLLCHIVRVALGARTFTGDNCS